eukprot:590643_1
MSSTRKTNNNNNNQRRSNSYNNAVQQSSNNNKSQQQKRGRYVAKYGGTDRQYSPKQSPPKRYNQRSSYGYSHTNASEDEAHIDGGDAANDNNNNKSNNTQRFKLKPTQHHQHQHQHQHQQHNQYNNHQYNNAHPHKKHNDAMPPGFNANNNDQSYPPNRYRPNDTNNSERNRNWRNRFNPELNANASDMSPSFRARTMNSHSHHSHSRSPPHNMNQNVHSNAMNDIANVSPLIGSAQGQAPEAADAAENAEDDVITVDASSDLFGTLYGTTGVDPSIAYPVIKLCLNRDCTTSDDPSIEQRKYPVDWLLGIGSKIREGPTHPKNDIPESVRFMHTIHIAGNKWKKQTTTKQTISNTTSSWRKQPQQTEPEEEEEEEECEQPLDIVESPPLPPVPPPQEEEEEDSEDLDAYKVQHHTPELRPDPREIVSEDELNVAPEWAGEDDSEEITKDFKFAVLDKDKEKEHLNNTGQLPPRTTTISHEEYEERQKEKEEGGDKPRKPPIPHPQGFGQGFGPGFGGVSSLRDVSRRTASSMRSQSTPDPHNARYHAAAEPLPIDKLPSRIRGIVIRLDEDIAKISSYIQQVALEKDQLNRYQRHLHKLIARRGQYANWWKTQQKKHQNTLAPSAQPSGASGGGLRHANSLQQLEHYKDYYNKQLEKMKASASTDQKFNTYVDYYRQKLRAVEKRQRELESARNAKTKGASIIDVISPDKDGDKDAANANDNDDPFGSLDLGLMGYTTANTTNTSTPSKPNANAQLQKQQTEDAMWGYMYGGQPPQPQPPKPTPQQRNISAQKAKLKAYIRQHALKYVKPPPDPTDETYPHWYQGLRKVENIIYTKYMNKQRKRMDAAAAAASAATAE